MAGAAVTTALQQLKELLKITYFTSETGFITSVMKSVFGHIDEWNWRSIAIGLAFLGFILFAIKTLVCTTTTVQHQASESQKNKKKQFWVSAIAYLTSAILSTLFEFLTKADKHSVKNVVHFEKRIGPVSAHQCFLSGSLPAARAKIGLIGSLIAVSEGDAAGRAFAALRDEHIDGNKETIAFSVTNLCGNIASGSSSSSDENSQAGVYTTMSDVVMSIVVLITLMVLTPSFNIILSVIIISAVLSLIDLRVAWLIWKIDKFDILDCLGVFVGVFFVAFEIGLLIPVCFSSVKILYNISRPRTARLGTVVTNVYRNVKQYPNAALVPGVLAIRVDAAIYFCNSISIYDKIVHYLEGETPNWQRLEEPGFSTLLQTRPLLQMLRRVGSLPLRIWNILRSERTYSWLSRIQARWSSLNLMTPSF